MASIPAAGGNIAIFGGMTIEKKMTFWNPFSYKKA